MGNTARARESLGREEMGGRAKKNEGRNEVGVRGSKERREHGWVFWAV